MARLSKELIMAIDKEIEKHKDIFNVLKNCGGILYLTDLAILLDKPSSTLKYQIKNSVKLELLEISKSPCGRTKRDVVRLTTRTWRKFNINREKVSIQDITIDRCLFKAIINKRLNFMSKKEDLLRELDLDGLKYSIIDGNRKHYNTKSLSENHYKIKKSNKILIKDYRLDIENKDVFLDFYYVSRRLSDIEFSELKEFIDIVVGLYEYYCYRNDNDFYSINNYVKMNLSVITEDDFNTDDKLKEIKNHKRNYHSFTKQKISRKKDLFYSIKFIFNNKINFIRIDKNMYSLTKI